MVEASFATTDSPTAYDHSMQAFVFELAADWFAHVAVSMCLEVVLMYLEAVVRSARPSKICVRMCIELGGGGLSIPHAMPSISHSNL